MAYDPTHEHEHNYHPSIEARKLAKRCTLKRNFGSHLMTALKRSSILWLATAQKAKAFSQRCNKGGSGSLDRLHPTCVTLW